MRMNRFISVLMIVLLFAGSAYADDFDDFAFDDFSFDDFGFGGSDGSSSPVSVSGNVSANARTYISGDEESIADCLSSGGFDADLEVKYSGTNADATVVFNLNADTLKNNIEGLVDEAYGTAYFGNFRLEAGKMKTVWGKGDKLHVIDNFNADDYTDFIIPDYFDRRVATPMVKASYVFDYAGDLLSNVKVEAVYTPFLPVDRFATTGVWTPAKVNALTGAVTGAATEKLSTLVERLETLRLLAAAGNAADAITAGYFSTAEVSALAGQLIASGLASDSTDAQTKAVKKLFKDALTDANTAYLLALNAASALSSDPAMIYPDTNTLRYSQAGVRLTGSLGAVDLGLSYYYGHYKQPSVNGAKIDSWLAAYLSDAELSEDDSFLAYDSKQTFGIEAATILWHFNVRGEACYNLTDDTAGDDPWVHNNSVQWLAGFDIDLPFWNMNVNIQETGTYVLKNGEIKGSTTELADVDYSANGYTNNKIAANITTSFKNEKICPEATVMYGIENGDVVVMPKIVFNPNGEVSLTVSGMYDWCRDEDSEFTGWDKNNFLQLGAKVTF